MRYWASGIKKTRRRDLADFFRDEDKSNLKENIENDVLALGSSFYGRAGGASGHEAAFHGLHVPKGVRFVFCEILL